MQLTFRDNAPATPAIVPRWYQAEATEACWAALRTESPCVVIPTGGGKSLVIAMLCQKAMTFNGRVMVLQPSKELIEQNAEECQKLLPTANVGLYSAGLKKRHTDHDIVFAGIQSCFDKAHLFGRRDLVLIDEAHLIPPDGEGRYRTFLKDLRELCPHFRLAGLTATPFRTGTGALCGPQNLLTKVCYSASVSRLMTEADPATGIPFLCPVVNQPTRSEVDTSGLKVLARTGEFDERQAEDLFDTDANVMAAVDEIITATHDRKSILLFTSGIKHAGHVAAVLASKSGERVGLVTGDTLDIERVNYLSDFKAQRLRWLVNVNVLTTGFNARGVDAIAVLRATASPGLFAQICGRGFRTYPTKTNCLILDFGENIKRHGALDSDDYGVSRQPKERDADGDGQAPQKECPGCSSPLALSVKVCPECGFVWPEKDKHKKKADTEAAILQSQIEPIEYIVESVTMWRHEKRNAPDAPNTLRVDYVCQLAEGGGNLTKKTISEWVCLDHQGFTRSNANKWWCLRSKATLESDLNDSRIDSAINLFRRGAVAVANRIWVIPQGRFNRIVRQELDEVPETWSEPVEINADDPVDDWSPNYFGGQLVGSDVPF